MDDQTLPLDLENRKAVEREFDAAYSKLNVLARFFAPQGASDESDMTLDWSERQGVALMLREITDNLDHLWEGMTSPALQANPALALGASRRAA